MKNSLILLLALTSFSCSDIQLAPDDELPTRIVYDGMTQVDRIDNLDILVSLDSSCSMNDNLDDVSYGLSSLAATLTNTVNSWDMAFIPSSDVANDNVLGVFSEETELLEIESAPHNLYSTNVEKGFLGVYDFFTSEHVEEENSELFEGDDPLIILFISDEDDASHFNVSTFYDWLTRLRTNIDVISVVNTRESVQHMCLGPDDIVGQKYIELTELFENDAISLCDNEWANWLGAYSTLIPTIVSVELTETPIDNVSVYVDHNAWPVELWEFNIEENSVYVSEVPAGASISVIYEVFE